MLLDTESELSSAQATAVLDAAEAELLTNSDVAVNGHVRAPKRRRSFKTHRLYTENILHGTHSAWYWGYGYECELQDDEKRRKF